MHAQRGSAPEFSGEMIGWVLRGFSVGSHGYSWVLMGTHGFSVGTHGFSWVLSGYSDCAFLGSQGVLRQAPLLCQVCPGVIGHDWPRPLARAKLVVCKSLVLALPHTVVTEHYSGLLSSQNGTSVD